MKMEAVISSETLVMYIRLYGVTFQKTVICIDVAASASGLTHYFFPGHFFPLQISNSNFVNWANQPKTTPNYCPYCLAYARVLFRLKAQNTIS
jgi:hypothetical protein